MEFPQQFSADLHEAFEYWKDVQESAGKPQSLSLEQWIMNLLRQPVYALIGEKRVRADG